MIVKQEVIQRSRGELSDKVLEKRDYR
jgi:hypothetical protein